MLLAFTDASRCGLKQFIVVTQKKVQSGRRETVCRFFFLCGRMMAD
jgi:hypothetical protein